MWFLAAPRNGAQATQIIRLSALLGGGAHDNVFDHRRIDASSRHGFAHHMAARSGRLGVVKSPAEGFS
ncbi:MAG: hypothetical protein ACJAZ0_001116 [Halioglobus sp.]|jgi:hypothetical protein